LEEYDPLSKNYKEVGGKEDHGLRRKRVVKFYLMQGPGNKDNAAPKSKWQTRFCIGTNLEKNDKTKLEGEEQENGNRLKTVKASFIQSGGGQVEKKRGSGPGRKAPG